MFDLRQFLTTHRIDWVDVGPNVKKGNINVACPFCGDDPSHHLGIHPETGMWGCWRNKGHRGRKLHRLLVRLTRLSPEQIEVMLGKGASVVDADVFTSIVSGDFFDVKGVPTDGVASLVMPREFLKFPSTRKVAATRFHRYLQGRGLKVTKDLVDRYELRYCYQGVWADRIIFPVYLDGVLVTWTGRTIRSDVMVRYRSLSTEDSVLSIKATVYNYDNVEDGGDCLFIVEGPLDCLKMDWYGNQGCASVALFSANISSEQLALVSGLAKRYRRVGVLLDAGYIGLSNKLWRDLAPLKDVVMCQLPSGVADPGDLSCSQVIALCEEYS